MFATKAHRLLPWPEGRVISPDNIIPRKNPLNYNDTVVEVNDYMIVCLTREKKSDCFTDKTHSIGY